MATLAAWNLASQQTMAEEPNDSVSEWRITCIAPAKFNNTGIWLMTTQAVEGQAIRVRAKVFLRSAAANQNADGSSRDVDIEEWPGNGPAKLNPDTYLFLRGERAHKNLEDWQLFDEEKTDPEIYQLTVKQPPDADQGRIVRTDEVPAKLMAAKTNQPFRIKFVRVDRSVTGDYFGSKFLCLSVIYEFRIQGTIEGEYFNELWRPCHDFLTNVDTPMVIHHWVSHHAGEPPPPPPQE